MVLQKHNYTGYQNLADYYYWNKDNTIIYAFCLAKRQKCPQYAKIYTCFTLFYSCFTKSLNC